VGRVYLVGDRAEIDRRRGLLGRAQLVEVWQDLYPPDARSGTFWMGETSKRALDGVGEELPFLLAVEDTAVPVYYGARLTDVDSLPAEDSLRARVLSAHGIAAAWVTYNRLGERNDYEPKAPTDATFYLRRPGGRAAHLWCLFRTKREAVGYMTEHFGPDPEAVGWAQRLASEDFQGLLERYGQKG
jgi:hypothetical protein